MGFVYEKFRAEEENRPELSSVEIMGRKVEISPSYWVIDTTLDEFLVWAYPEREPPYPIWYVFFMQGKTFPVLVEETDEMNATTGKYIIKLRINVDIPGHVFMTQEQLEAIKGIVKPKIREALRTYFWESKMALGQAKFFESVQILN